jgi:hypothetical protein
LASALKNHYILSKTAVFTEFHFFVDFGIGDAKTKLHAVAAGNKWNKFVIINKPADSAVPPQ